MNGIAQTSAAITIANALPTGVGCAAGIELMAEARIELEPEGSGLPKSVVLPSESRTPLVEEALQIGLSRYFPDQKVTVRLSLKSDIPIGRGLKSSSAASSAILLAVARAAGNEPTSLEIGLLSAEAGRRSGVSATGALDDALAGLDPGIVVTNNVRGEVLRRSEADPDWGVALYIPSQVHPPSPDLRAAFQAERSAGETVARAATNGDWITAMRLNTELVEKAMGYSYATIRERLRGRGAIASGVSGLGPTLAAIAPIGRIPELLRSLPTDSSRTLAVRFTRTRRDDGGAS